jgi:uncharacterized protein YneF (UPF0154 family)
MKNGKWIWEQVALPLVSLLIGGIVGYFASQQAMQKQISVSGENIAALQIQQTSTEARIASLSQKFEGVDQAIGVVENLKERVERVSTSVDETLSKWSRADEKVTELENNSTVLVGRIKGVDPIVARRLDIPAGGINIAAKTGLGKDKPPNHHDHQQDHEQRGLWHQCDVAGGDFQ